MTTSVVLVAVCGRCAERSEPVTVAQRLPSGWKRVISGTGRETFLCFRCSGDFDKWVQYGPGTVTRSGRLR